MKVLGVRSTWVRYKLQGGIVHTSIHEGRMSSAVGVREKEIGLVFGEMVFGAHSMPFRTDHVNENKRK